MKLLLIGPSRYNDDGSIFKRDRSTFPRLNLLHLAGLTPKDIDVKIVEESIEDIDFQTDCDVIGITAFTTQAPRAYVIADKFRSIGKTVIMGGIHASALPQEAKEHVDSVIIGETENLWKTILDDINKNKLKPTYSSNKFHDLKDLPVPRYDLINREKYPLRTMPVQASRGCPHNCDFCTVTRFFGGSYRLRPIDEVIRDVKAAEAKRIFFVDDNIIANRSYAKELFNRLIPLKIRWVGQSTINLGRFPDLCKLASKSGCFTLCLGIESINQKSLNSIDKGHNKVQEYHKLLKTINDNGISLTLSMIVGFDDDDDSIFNDTVKFVSEVKPLFANINTPFPYPGTKLTKKLESENRILHRDWSKYRAREVVFKPTLLGVEELKTKALAAFQETYTFNSIIKRCLAQPKKHILHSFLFNLKARKNALKGETFNSG